MYYVEPVQMEMCQILESLVFCYYVLNRLWAPHMHAILYSLRPFSLTFLPKAPRIHAKKHTMKLVRFYCQSA